MLPELVFLFFHKFAKKVANFRFGKCAMGTPIRASSWASSGGTFYAYHSRGSCYSQVYEKSCNFSFFILRIWVRQFGPPPGLPLVARSSRPTLAVLVNCKVMKKVATFRFFILRIRVRQLWPPLGRSWKHPCGAFRAHFVQRSP